MDLPAGLAAMCDRIREEANVRGMVPLHVLTDVLDDMAHITTATAGWSCASYRKNGLHWECPHHDYTPADPAARARRKLYPEQESA